MPFRLAASIDANQHKGLIALNSISGNPLVLTGLSLTNAQPLHVAIVDASGSQVVPTSSTGTQDVNISKWGNTATTLGQKARTASVPTTLSTEDITALTPPPAISGFATSANQTNGNQQVQGNIASASADSGNPVKVGGKYNTTLPTLTNGQRGDFQLTARSELQVNSADSSATGTITTPDAVVAAPAGAGATVTGASTAGSLVALQCPGGDSSWIMQVSGTLGGSTYYFEGSLDSTTGTDGTWINVNGRQTGIVNTVLAGNTTVAGVFRGNTSGWTWIRMRAVGGAGITAAVKLEVSSGTGAIFLNASIPSGSNIIGSVGKKVGTATTSANVSTSTTVATLVASNTSRIKATVYNDSAGFLYIKEGAAASATSYDYALAPATATSPGGLLICDDYNGIITGILSTGTGTARTGET